MYTDFQGVQMEVELAAAASKEAIGVCTRAEHGLPPNALVSDVWHQATWLGDTAAVVQGLRCPQMHDRHWARLRASLPSIPAKAAASLTVADICSCGLVDAKDR